MHRLKTRIVKIEVEITTEFIYDLVYKKCYKWGDEVEMKKGIQPNGMLTRKKILSASVKVFLEKGYEGATAKEIADLAGSSTGAPFALFGNKEGVLLELVRMMFSGQFELIENLIGEGGDPLLLYGVVTSLQIHITELSWQLRELYVMAYSLSSTSEYVYKLMASKTSVIFGRYLPHCESKDFYELVVASASIMRGFMAMPCDMYFTIERKLRRLLQCCYKIYDVPPEKYEPVIEQILQMDLKHMAEQMIARTVQTAETNFQITMTTEKQK